MLVLDYTANACPSIFFLTLVERWFVEKSKKLMEMAFAHEEPIAYTAAVNLMLWI